MDLAHVRHGRSSIRPYIFGPLELPDFVKEVLGATELERHEFGPDSAHVELSIGDSIIVIEAGQLPPSVTPTVSSIYVYVPDVDAVFAQAIQAGASEIAAPSDKPYSERQCGFKDTFGNTWWVASYIGS